MDVAYPTFHVDRVLTTRDRLIDKVLSDRYGEELTGDSVIRLCYDLRRVLPSGIEFHVMFESLRWLAGRMLTRELCFDIAWRFAGNVERLQAGNVVLPWSVQLLDEWVPVQVTSALRNKDRWDHTGLELSLRVMAGSPCPMVFRAFRQHSELDRIALAIGFSRSTGKYPYEKGEQLVGLRFLVFVEALKSRDQPWFRQVAPPGWCITFNREILKTRMRIKPCPNGWSHPCHQCPVGYEVCPAGTHRLNYVKRMCPQCNKEWFFDDDVTTAVCVQCATKNRMARS